MKRYLGGFLALISVMATARGAIAGLHYSVTELASSAPDSTVFPAAINDSGEVTGHIQVPNIQTEAFDDVPFLYRDGNFKNLLAGTSLTYGEGVAIDRDGNVGANVGTWYSDPHPAVLAKGEVSILPNPDFVDIVQSGNENGELVGYAGTGKRGTVVDKAISWEKGKLNVLKGVPTDSKATAINSSGEIVGFYQTANGINHAFSWMNGVLGTFVRDSYSMGAIRSINAQGDVVGNGYDPKGNFTYFAIISDKVINFPDVLGKSEFFPDAINSADQIVGESNGTSGRQAALFEDGNTINLNSTINPRLGYQLEQAVDINNRGQILATGIAGGRQVGFILTPQTIPLPASLWMGLTTLPLLGIALRAKHRAAT